MQGSPSATRAIGWAIAAVGDHHMRAAGAGDARRLDLGAHAAARRLGSGAAGHRLDLRRQPLDHRNQPRRRTLLRRRVVEAGDVGEQDQQIGARHGGDAGGEPIVVAVADLARRHRVVLVDDRHGAHRRQAAERLARVEIAAALLGVLQRQQHLAGDDAVPMQAQRPGARQRDLADRRRRLAVLELQRAALEAGDAPAERDRSRGDDQHVGAALVQRGEVVDQSLEPVLLERALGGVDQQRRADLDDNSRELIEFGQRRHGRLPASGKRKAVA